jgi:hypothetical protein
MVRLSENTRKEIYLAIQSDNFTPAELRKKYNISGVTLMNIKRAYTVESDVEEINDDSQSISSSVSRHSSVSQVSQVSRKSTPKKTKEVFQKNSYSYLPTVESPPPDALSEQPPPPPPHSFFQKPSPDDTMLFDQLMNDDSPPPPPPPRDEVYILPTKSQNTQQSERKQALICKITAYLDSFKHKLIHITNSDPQGYVANLQSQSEEELTGVLGAIRYSVSNTGISDSVMLGFSTAIQTVEKLGEYAGLKLNGLNDALLMNESAKDAVREMSIELLSEISVSPQKRLIGIVIMSAYSVHTKNSLEGTMSSVLSEKVDLADEKLQSYSDL